MKCACKAASGDGPPMFTDDVTVDGSSRMNHEVYRAELSTQIPPKHK